MEALHYNDIPDDNRVENLRWGTSSQNSLDKVRNGNHPMTRRTHCPYGHPLESPNLVATSPTRNCLACSRARVYARYHGIPYTAEIAAPYFEQIMASTYNEGTTTS